MSDNEELRWEEKMESFIDALKGISYFRILFQHIDELEKELSELKKRNEELEKTISNIEFDNKQLRKELSEARKEVCDEIEKGLK